MKHSLILTFFYLSLNIYSQSNKNNNWQHLDFIQDKVPGISLDKTYNKIINDKKRKKIIVAVLDTQIDLNHEDLKPSIWLNKNEIPNNNIDDDKNGYVDDVNGWSFVGTKSGNYTVWSNFEYIRILRKFNLPFNNKTEKEVKTEEIFDYSEYKRAKVKFQKDFAYYSEWLKSLNHRINVYPMVKDTLKRFFINESYTYEQLDSVYKIYRIDDFKYTKKRDLGLNDIASLVYYRMVDFKSGNKNLNSMLDEQVEIDSIVNKNLNINYNERILIGDNETILEKGYGNNKIYANIKGIRSIRGHSTKVSSIIAANRQNNIGIHGFSDNIEIMPLNISPSGDEHDKDISMAIKYAVDNGAKIINMSFTKEFSLEKQWVFDALKYAEKNNVLIVHISGNDSFDIDKNPIYPNDTNYQDDNEVVSNFINVGSTNKKLDSTFVSSFSNYGKKNVDLFAPGEQIYTAIPDNKYDFDSGTSLAAPMVSGTAALIWLYYPKLTVSQVKQIILDFGTTYDIEVIVPGTKDKKVKFSELSKSGKVLNVYNAMKMAKEMNSKKK